MERHRQIEHKLKAQFFFVLFYDEDGLSDCPYCVKM